MCRVIFVKLLTQPPINENPYRRQRKQVSSSLRIGIQSKTRPKLTQASSPVKTGPTSQNRIENLGVLPAHMTRVNQQIFLFPNGGKTAYYSASGRKNSRTRRYIFPLWKIGAPVVLPQDWCTNYLYDPTGNRSI